MFDSDFPLCIRPWQALGNLSDLFGCPWKTLAYLFRRHVIQQEKGRHMDSALFPLSIVSGM